ncbi:MAG TPA: transporter [Steroidobacteraceae bacterium]|nr:transporter [Steroidobacteraceae bacterium]
MTGRLFSVLVAITACLTPRTLPAQFTDPRTYTLSPVGINELELDYAYAQTNASLDTPVVVAGAHVEANEVLVSYTYKFGVLGHLAWVEAIVPFASLRGSISGTDISGSTTGTGDSSLQLAVLLKGGQALSAGQFAKYVPSTTLGVSLTVTAPTGKYNADRLLNLGSNRWSLKPEFALSQPFGPEQKWEFDAYINACFFTDNTEYRGVEILRQEPLPGIEGHISYSVTPSLWASLDLRYSYRGETVVDGLDENNAQQNLTIGAEANWSPNSRNSLELVFAKAVVHQNSPAYTGVGLKYFYSWGSGIE